MAELFKVNAPVRKPLFEGVQGENEARSIQFDIEPWVTELGDGAVTATAKRSQDSQPYPVTVTKDGNIVTWKPTSTDTAYAGVGLFQLEYTVDSVLAKTCIWSTMVAPSLDPAGDPPDPYDNWLAEMRQIAADALQDAQDADASAQDAEAWAKGTKNGTPVASTDEQYENNAKYWAEQSLANQYGAFIVKSASGEIASFSDGADDVPMKSLKVSIEPTQTGSGTPSPDNPRPITGQTGASVTVDGKNLLNRATEEAGYISASGVITDDGGYSKHSALIPVDAGDYVFSGIGTRSAGNKRVHAYDANGNWLRQLGFVGSSGGFFSVSVTVTSDVSYIRTSYMAADTELMFEKGSTPTAYQPYSTAQYSIAFGETVYGGTVDFITGVLTIDRIKQTKVWGNGAGTTQLGSYTRKVFTISEASTLNRPDKPQLCTVAPYVGSYTDQSTHFYVDGNIAGAYAIVVILPSDTSASLEFDVLYELATYKTIQLTPTIVKSIFGANEVKPNAGDVSVEYRADPTLAYAELQALILENL